MARLLSRGCALGLFAALSLLSAGCGQTADQTKATEATDKSVAQTDDKDEHAGHVHGETDELGYFVTKDKVGIHDLQLTILHLLGIDGKRLSFPYQGLNQRLIGPSDEARLIEGVLA